LHVQLLIIIIIIIIIIMMDIRISFYISRLILYILKLIIM
jgi:hypothetical protein